MPLQEVNISIGTQIRSGSPMINTHWHAKIDTQQDAHRIFIFVKYEECSPKNHESTRRTEVGPIS